MKVSDILHSKGGTIYSTTPEEPLADALRTMAELGDDEKDAISHRGRAARALETWLRR